MPPTPHRPRFALALAGTLTLTAALAGCGGTGTAGGDGRVVTVYSADGLKGTSAEGWYDAQFKAFEKQTGITVKYVEGGSGEIVQRAVREKNNTQADVLVTLPPFIQQAEGEGLLEPYKPRGWGKVAAADKAADGSWTSLVKNYAGFIRNSEKLSQKPETWRDLLDEKYQDKLQYSTPGVAGDGTAVLIKAMHDFGGLKPAMDYFEKLQENNVGPSSSTSKLGPKVDKGELLVANGDVQMNFAQARSMPNLDIWFPAREGGEPSTFALPYAAGLTKSAPQSENGKKLLDFLLGKKAQLDVSATGGGFPARTDVDPEDENAAALDRIMEGVKVFRPDWRKIDRNYDTYIDAWEGATGS
ncbi:2-aminoethylphosphonate ABC transporter substrate-binding protein [Streptomyces oceani]|uniref:2-aminoethylphosphonate ABC transporter substrate-binding protein n=1 Tax=Streptomyces oceani TaxID=1075402 RepID=A0A1E7KKB7_9ACTN|nr:2-aminoethylphosphonate ABC transporter substrate-binding protein [Streptomyces oceani]OEV04330.1 2-aminoethylphosphonate ABC transporter substrate-binding protein [Streptomyces oceani]